MEATELKFTPAARKRTPLKIAISGPSGAGKTWSSLLIAKGITEGLPEEDRRIAVIDTENASACLYADDPELGVAFDVLEIEPPYLVEKYIKAIEAAVRAGYKVLVIDSLTHAWDGEGGILAEVDKVKGRGGNSFAAWAPAKSNQRHFIAWLLKTDIHLICTMRSKMMHAQNTENGRTEIVKLGMNPIQGDNMEYEFTIAIELAMDHSGKASKTRVRHLDGRIFDVNAGVGKYLIDWRNSAGAEAPKYDLKVEAPKVDTTPAGRSIANGDGNGRGSVKVNKHAGTCVDCGGNVPENKGTLTKDEKTGKWDVHHSAGACPPKSSAPPAELSIADEIQTLATSLGKTGAQMVLLARQSGAKTTDWRTEAPEVMDRMRSVLADQRAALEEKRA